MIRHYSHEIFGYSIIECSDILSYTNLNILQVELILNMSSTYSHILIKNIIAIKRPPLLKKSCVGLCMIVKKLEWQRKI